MLQSRLVLLKKGGVEGGDVWGVKGVERGCVCVSVVDEGDKGEFRGGGGT